VKKSAWAAFPVILLVLASCGQPPAVEQAEQSLLFLRSSSGVALIEPGAAEAAYVGTTSVPTRDWSTVVRAYVVDGETRLTSLDPETKSEHWAQTLPGRLRVKVVSEDGRIAALSPRREGSYLSGRKETRLTIVRSNGDSDEFTLKGNYEPEAFSTDGQSLFVISYLPARAPTKYQVRRLDLTSGAVKGVYTPHEELQEAMGGTARIQQGSPDGKRLYTLYTVGRGDNGYAFIHVLSLDELWAHCIALPEGFAEGPERATALSVSPDGSRLYVTNSDSEMVAEIDTEDLAVARSSPVEMGFRGKTHATNPSNSTMYVASDAEITAVDTSDLSELQRWTMEDTVTGLQGSADGLKLYVGLSKHITTIDIASGEMIETIDPPGIGRITQLGPEGPPLEKEVSKVLKCAC
jgi:YVTN family beta-propeller protein